MDGAASPSGANVFATVGDVPAPWDGDITDIDVTSSADIGEALDDADQAIVYNTSATAWVRATLSRWWEYYLNKIAAHTGNLVIGGGGGVNVGVNVPAPARELHVKGLVRIDRDVDSSAIFLTRTLGGTGDVIQGFVLGTRGVNGGDLSINDLGTSAGGVGTQKIIVKAGGGVAIDPRADIVPETALDVYGALTLQPVSADPAAPAAGGGVLWVSDGTGTGSAGDLLLRDAGGIINISAIAASGWDGDITDIDLDGGTDIGADLADADLILVDDGAGGTNRKSALSRVWTYISAKIAALTDISTWASVLDEDTMASDSATKVPTQQSVKAYVDANAGGGDATSIKSKTVTVDALSDGDILVYRSGSDEWEVEAKPASGANPALSDVSDVTLTAPADNEVLAYDNGTGEWINQTAAEAGLEVAGAATTAVSGHETTYDHDEFVTGPASAPNNAVPRFDGTTGALIQSSGIEIADEASNIIQVTATNPAGDTVHFAANPGVNSTGFLFGKTTSTPQAANGAYTAYFKGPTGGAYNHAAGFEAGESGAEIVHMYNVAGTHLLKFNTDVDEELYISGLEATAGNEQWRLELGTDPFMVFGGAAADRVGTNELTVVGSGEFTTGLTVGGEAVAPKYPARATKTAAATTDFELNGTAYTCQLNANITTLSASLPSGGNAANFEYGCRIDFTPPATGTFTVTIPGTWEQAGPLDAISLSDTDVGILVILSTKADGTIVYTAQALA
jgi:hypothetical protein